jgi:hypothetical protein
VPLLHIRCEGHTGWISHATHPVSRTPLTQPNQQEFSRTKRVSLSGRYLMDTPTPHLGLLTFEIGGALLEEGRNVILSFFDPGFRFDFLHSRSMNTSNRIEQ